MIFMLTPEIVSSGGAVRDLAVDVDSRRLREREARHAGIRLCAA
jgi:hypothetical protein